MQGYVLHNLPTVHHFENFILNDFMKIGGFPIEIETKISKLITYGLDMYIFHNIKIAYLAICNKLAYFGFYFDRKSTL